MEFEIVQPIEEHARQIMEWRNDPDTLKWSYHSTPKKWESFFTEFLDDFFCFPELPPLFALDQGVRAAFLLLEPVEHPFHPHRTCVEVSINVAPSMRGKHIGHRCLESLKTLLSVRDFDDLYAEVKRENDISHKLFLGVGFQKIDETKRTIEDIGKTFEIARYLLPLKPERERQPVFIIAEAGSNWNVDDPLKTAKQMIEAAKEAGADAVKFQTFRPGKIYVENAGKSGYLSNAGIDVEMQELFQDLAMPYEMIPELVEYCNICGIEWMSTPFSEEDFKAVDPFVERHKIASYEIGHIHLLRLAAESGKPTFLSTGAATEEEVAWAVNTYHQFGGKELTLLQCTAQYPAAIDQMNLRAIPWMAKRFHTPVGLSDHSSDPIQAPIAAVALGATVIEKHFTLDRTLPGPDHAFAITPPELKQMVKSIRATEQMLGTGIKTVQPREKELRSFARRGIQALCSIKEGEPFHEGKNIALLRPGVQPLGVHPRYLNELEGKTAKRPLSKGEGIQRGDW